MKKRKITKTKRKTRKNYKQEKSKTLLLIIFFFIIIATVVFLDYMNLKKNKTSFLFSKKKQIVPTYNKKNFLLLLDDFSLPYSSFKDKKGLRHFRIETLANLKFPLMKKIKVFCKENNLAIIKLESKKGLELYKIQKNNKDNFFLLISEKVKTIKKIAKKKPKLIIPQKRKIIKQNSVAFIIDDVGSYLLGAKEFDALNIPITLSVLIDSKFAAKEIALLQNSKNIESMIHLPMQAQGVALNHYNRKITITIKSSPQEIEELIKRSKRAIPFAKGINNHEGSLLTSNYFSTRIVIKKLKKYKFFFIDSRTSGKSVGYKIAREEGVPSAQRDVFLDHKVDFDYSCKQIISLVKIAKKNGSAIAIGHPHPSTYKAIKKMIPYIKKNSIKFVHASQLLIY